MKVSFHRLAAAELIAAAQHLEREAGLGHAFLDDYQAWEAQIRRFPESCPEITAGIHRGYLERFKYHVTYTLRGASIRILYVRHAKQKPLAAYTRK